MVGTAGPMDDRVASALQGGIGVVGHSMGLEVTLFMVVVVSAVLELK